MQLRDFSVIRLYGMKMEDGGKISCIGKVSAGEKNTVPEGIE